MADTGRHVQDDLWDLAQHAQLQSDLEDLLERARGLRRRVIQVPAKAVARDAAQARLEHVGYRRMAVSAVGRLERALEDSILLLAAGEAEWMASPNESADDPRLLSWLRGLV